MNSRERLMATLRGEVVDHPAVNFYEVGGFAINPDDPDPFNIYNDPSWQPLLRLAREKSDLICMRGPVLRPGANNSHKEFFSVQTAIENGSRITRTTLRVGGRTMTEVTKRDPEIDTIWVVEHLLKDVDDLKAYLQLPDSVFDVEPDVTNLFTEDAKLGDRGIVMVDTGDPICSAASLFAMDVFTVMAYTENELFHQLLEKFARWIQPLTEKVSAGFPGHLWRIYGPEYAAEPYLPTGLFDEYVVRYTGPMVKAIQKHGGFARLHCHGHISKLLPYFAGMGVDAIDPIEPPPQGDVQLIDVRRQYGRDMVLFGNLEARDIENLPSSEFEQVVAQALREGTDGEGRGFVLLPSSSPYGRTITPKALANYETMVRLAREFGG